MYKVHESALVDSGAKIGKNSKIWHWTHISSGAVIGENCNIGQNVFISNKVTIGNRVKIQNNISIFDMVTIEDDVFCGPSVVFTNVKNPRSRFPRKDEYQRTIIRKGATLGANSTILCGVKIGLGAFIGSGAVVTKDVNDFSLVVGNPARHIGWMSEYGVRMDHDLQDFGKYICPHTSSEYILKDGLCLKIN